MLFATLASFPMSAARSEGIWDQTLVAGVKNYEIFMAQFIFTFIQCNISIFIYLFTFCLFPKFEIFKCFWEIYSMLFFFAIVCILLEFWMSCVTKKFHLICHANIALYLTFQTISGLVW